MKNEETILLRINGEVKEKLVKKAESLGFSLSAYIRLMIIQDLLI
jgi:antitoxin component of RelBE/YafQ-DinJ toxin-antitoxin module